VARERTAEHRSRGYALSWKRMLDTYLMLKKQRTTRLARPIGLTLRAERVGGRHQARAVDAPRVAKYAVRVNGHSMNLSELTPQSDDSLPEHP